MGVRIATPQDGPAVAAIYEPYVRETAISFEDVPPTAEMMATRIATTLRTHPFLVFEDEGAILGYAYAGKHRERAAYRWSVDVAVYVAAQAHRRGVGRALYETLLPILRRQGFHAAYAGILMGNDGSIRLHEAVGFTLIGVYAEVGFKLGAWQDVGWWGARLSDQAPTGEPVPFASL